MPSGSTSGHEKQPFPSKVKPGALVEAPISTEEHDCLHFTAYAEAIAVHLRTYSAWPIGVGIFAQWGAGKVLNQQRRAFVLDQVDICYSVESDNCTGMHNVVSLSWIMLMFDSSRSHPVSSLNQLGVKRLRFWILSHSL